MLQYTVVHRDVEEVAVDGQLELGIVHRGALSQAQKFIIKDAERPLLYGLIHLGV